MDAKQIMKALNDCGAMITDSHVVYTSGRHGSAYVNKDAIYPHTRFTSELCREMAALYKGENVSVVAGPTVGGVILAQWTAHHLSELCGREVIAVFAEEGEGKARIFRRGYDKLIAGKKVLVVEDVLTTGGSVKKVADAVAALGGDVAGCAAICNRGGVDAASIGVPEIKALIAIKLDSWDAGDCPLCKSRVPINVSIGKG